MATATLTTKQAELLEWCRKCVDITVEAGRVKGVIRKDDGTITYPSFATTQPVFFALVRAGLLVKSVNQVTFFVTYNVAR